MSVISSAWVRIVDVNPVESGNTVCPALVSVHPAASNAAVPIRETIRNAREKGSPLKPTLKTRIPGVLSLRDGRQTTSRRGAHPLGGQAVIDATCAKGGSR